MHSRGVVAHLILRERSEHVPGCHPSSLTGVLLGGVYASTWRRVTTPCWGRTLGTFTDVGRAARSILNVGGL